MGNDRQRDTGAAFVEIILAIVLFYLLIAGALEVSLYVIMQNQLTKAVRDGARIAAEISSYPTEPIPNPVIQQEVIQRIPMQNLLVPGSIQVNNTPLVDLAGLTDYFGNICSFQFVVEASAQYEFGYMPFFTIGTRDLYARTNSRWNRQPLCD